MADHGIKISIDDVDVKTATEDQLVFTTKYSMLKIVKVATLTYTFSSNPGAGCLTLGTVAHGLGYTPGFIVYCNFNYLASPYTILPLYFANGDPMTDFSQYIFTAYTNATNIVFRMCRDDTGSGDPVNLNGKTIIYKYYIFADPGA